MLRRKKAIVVTAVASFAASVVISLVLPAKYKSLAAFIPGGVEAELTGSHSFLSRLGAISETYASLIRVRRNYVIDYIVRSHRMAVLMDERFDLREMYGEDTVSEARRELGRKTYVNVRDEGVIEIAVEASDPVLARDMTAAYVEFVDSILVNVNIENAEAKTAFLERELARSEMERAAADSVLSEFMASRGIFELESQARAVFEIIGALTARIAALEVERSMMRMTQREDSHDLARLDAEIEMLREEIERASESGSADGLFPPLSDMPGLATEYLGMVAERMAQEFALAYIRLKLEDARLMSNRRISAVRVIDPPAVPERRSWPKRKQIVIVLTAASVLWASFIILVREKMRTEAAPGGEERV
jgi:capsule polysaccharide export protein KpsE/RkpR